MSKKTQVVIAAVAFLVVMIVLAAALPKALATLSFILSSIVAIVAVCTLLYAMSVNENRQKENLPDIQGEIGVGTMADDVSLEEFIKGTLGQILKGVEDTQADSSLKGIVCPATTSHSAQKNAFGVTKNLTPVFLIHFDIAVTTAESAEKSAGGGIKMHVVSLGGNVAKNTADSSVSRVVFDVPLAFHTIEKEDTGQAPGNGQSAEVVQ